MKRFGVALAALGGLAFFIQTIQFFSAEHQQFFPYDKSTKALSW